ncbi:MAG: branched-chain alpha-keto acid dehydrogenase subunit [Acidimicrobiaceae bacterium]|nr:branched-chain alpha-keto acid dehydrogenase subunit [Acidimicrobiaceae bacterium]
MEEIFVPASGMAMEDVLFAEWLKQPGDPVAAGEAVAVVETDKSTVELSGTTAGRLSRHLVAAGDRVRGGVTVAYVLAEGETEPGGSQEPAAPASALAPQPGASADPVPAKAAGGAHTMSPRQRRALARAEAPSAPPPFDPSALSGAPVEEPVEAALVPTADVDEAPGAPAASASTGSTATAPTSGSPAPRAASADSSNRRATAELVSESWRTVPHFSVGREVRAEGLLAALERLRSDGVKATVTDLLVSALGHALEGVGEASDVGLAVATEWGVLIPVLRGVASKSPAELAGQREAAVGRARARRMGSADATAPFATLSNLGTMGVDWFTGVVPLGQVALLTVGQIAQRAVVEGRGLVVAPSFTAILTADHRRYDGVDSARLLAGFAEHLDKLAGAGEEAS